MLLPAFLLAVVLVDSAGLETSGAHQRKDLETSGVLQPEGQLHSEVLVDSADLARHQQEGLEGNLAEMAVLADSEVSVVSEVSAAVQEDLEASAEALWVQIPA